MDWRRLNDLVREFSPQEAAVLREFAQRPQDEQLVYLFRELLDAKREASDAKAAVLDLKRGRPLMEKLQDFGMVGALVAYILFDNSDKLPPFLGGGGR